MELTIPSIAIGAFLILMLGFLGGCAYYSWENHYRFRKRGTSEIDVGVRLEGAVPQLEFFGLQAVNDLLVKGARVSALREGSVLTRQTGAEGDNAVMQWTGFTVKFEVTK